MPALEVLATLKSLGVLISKVPGAAGEYAKLTIQVMELADQNRALADEVRELKGKLEKKESVTIEGGRAWVTKPDGSRVGPYCMKCWEGKQLLSTLVPGRRPTMSGGHDTGLKCAQCDRFIKEGYEPPEGGNLPTDVSPR